MTKRILAVLGLIIGAVLLTVWHLHGLGLLAYVLLEVGLALLILYLALSISRLVDPGSGRMRGPRR